MLRRASACCGGSTPRHSIDIVATFDGTHDDGPEHPADFTFSAFAIDVDVESGALHITDVLFVTDVGQIISPVGHQGQIDGGFVYGLGPYGAKMAGELSNSGVAPALANAIHNAVGVRLQTFPLTSERISHALQSAGA